MSQPLISVLIPVYQVESYLKRCLDSVTAQTYKNLEIVMVDDGSTDDSVKIALDYKESSPIPTQIYLEKHLGVSNARQVLVEKASGEYVFFLDSDDYIDPNTIEILYNLCVENSAQMAQCKMIRTETSDFNEIDYNDGKIEIYTGDDLIDSYSCGTAGLLRCMLAAKLYKTEVIKNISFPIGKIHEDEYTMHRILGECRKILCTSLPLYYYYTNPNSIMKRAFTYKRYDIIDATADRIEFCLERGYGFSADMNRLKYCLHCIEMYYLTVKNYGSDDENLAMILEKCKDMYKNVSSSQYIDDNVKGIISNWLLNPMSDEVKDYNGYWKIAGENHKKHLEN